MRSLSNSASNSHQHPPGAFVRGRFSQAVSTIADNIRHRTREFSDPGPLLT